MPPGQPRAQGGAPHQEAVPARAQGELRPSPLQGEWQHQQQGWQVAAVCRWRGSSASTSPPSSAPPSPSHSPWRCPSRSATRGLARWDDNLHRVMRHTICIPPLQVCQTLVSTKPKVVTAQVPREVCGHLSQVRAPAPGPARTHLDTAARRSHPAPAPGAGQHRRHPAGPEEASSHAAAFRDSPVPLPGDTRHQELGDAGAEWSKDQRDLLYYFMMNGQKYE